MAKFAVTCGMLLTILGLVCYFFAEQLGADKKSVTALIPAFVGVPLILLGWLSMVKPEMRKHFMHFAVLLALLGAMAAMGRLIPVMIKKPSLAVGPVALIIMSTICIVYVIASVRSFIAARKAREAAGAATP